MNFAAKYGSIFRIRFVNGLQYRLAALAGLSTQFFWGFMEILLYRAFYKADLYLFWFTRSMANRVAKAALRCLPVLVVAFLLPEPFGMSLPVSLPVFFLSLVTMFLALLLAVSMTMIIYGLTFYTMSPLGLRTIFSSLAEFCSGDLVPLPFVPDGVQKVLEILPFASVQNLPFRIYSGDIAGFEILWGVALQVFWTAGLIALGALIFRNALQRAVVQGG